MHKLGLTLASSEQLRASRPLLQTAFPPPAAAAPHSAVAELGVVRRLSTSPVKQRDYVFLSLALIIVLTAGWLFYRFQNGTVIATARSNGYSCRITELPHERDRLAQFLRIGTGTKVYLCEVSGPGGAISSFGFTFAGSFIADGGSIDIHNTHPDERYDGYVEFHVGGYNTRCDFRLGDHAEWKKF